MSTIINATTVKVPNEIASRESNLRISYAFGFDEILLKPSDFSCVQSRQFSKVENLNPFGYGVPVIAANMAHLGTPEIATILAKYKIFTALDKDIGNQSLVKIVEDNSFAIPTFGANDFAKAYDFLNMSMYGGPVIFDTANGHMQHYINALNLFVDNFPNKVIAGNYAGPAASLSSKVVRKIGIGSGSLCATRQMTGIGYPQASLIRELTRATNLDLVSDGGVKNVGDIVKALALGAKAVMVGGLFMRTSEILGKTSVYGSSSSIAKQKEGQTFSEGKLAMSAIESLPSIETVCKSIIGGIASAQSYLNNELYKPTEKHFLHVSPQEQDNKFFGGNDVGIV